MENTQTKKPTKWKLNYKRTMLIGFAFFGILLLWQVYDTWCATLLTDIFKRKMGLSNEIEVQWLVGIIMACDNLAALILLPIFGYLSDRTKSPIGKRMPYILIGTLVVAMAFPFIPLFYHLDKVVGMVIMMGIVLLFMMMYRNPAVALMPDITPKPLRARANGVINIMGYFGGAFAAVMAIFLKVSDYINVADVTARNLWIIEIPFLAASVLMVISVLVLFFTIKENKIIDEMKDQLEEGERQAAVHTPIDDNKPMPLANKIMLFGILGAEFLWFMSENAIGTYLNNYIQYYLKASSSNTGTMTIIGGVGSVIGFAIAGIVADKIGRKWTVSIGLAITFLSVLTMCFIKMSPDTFVQAITDANGNIEELVYHVYPVLLFVVWFVKGFGMALVHNCSFPMVVELSSSKKIGKYTGLYYASSMSAQTVTPVLLGLIFLVAFNNGNTEAWSILPIYAATLMLLSFAVFSIVVKNIKAKKVENAKGLESFGADD